MSLNRGCRGFSAIILWIITLLILSNNVLANSYTSEVFSSLSSCEQQKDQNDKLYPNFYRSDCTRASNGNYYYNICDTNYCVTTVNVNDFKEVKDPGVYQYDTSNNLESSHKTTDYQLDDKTSQHIQKLAENLEKRFQKMSESDLNQWNNNFIQVLNQLEERSSNNDKNLALIQGIKEEVSKVIEKQKHEHDLCKNQFGKGWKEASFFFESENMVSWIEGNKKHTLACEYIEPKTQEENKPSQSDKNNQGSIDVYNPPVITDVPTTPPITFTPSQPILPITPVEPIAPIAPIEPILPVTPQEPTIDVTVPIQGLYRATSKKYTSSETYRYTKIDVCAKEFGLDWEESTKTYADPYIMLYNRYNIETSGYTQYWNGTKMVVTPKNKLLHKACVKNTLGTVIDDQYRITKGKYRGNILRDGDICKKEYGNDWKISKNKNAYQAVFERQSKDYPGLRAWQLFNEPGFDTCGGYHGNDAWNGSVYTTNAKQPITKADSCSFNPDKKFDSPKYHNNFVCERDKTSNEDITPVVQGLYKTTKNKYYYTSAYMQDYDFCKVEYGRSWKRSTESFDANIMLHKAYNVETWIYDPSGSQFSWIGDREKPQTPNNKNHIACVEDERHHYNENYIDYYTSTTAQGVHDFMKSIEKEMQSKINITNSHVIFNNKYAITQKKYYGNQIYSARKCPDGAEYCNNGYELSGICPVGYKLDDFSLKYNNYEKELIGYYLSKNRDNFNLTRENNGEKLGIHLWRWGKYDEKYSREFTLDRIKQEAKTLNFSAHKMILVNPGLSMRQTDRYNQYQYWSDIGTSQPVGTLLPALCVNKQAEINTANNKDKVQQDFKGIKTITDAVYMNDADIEGSSGIFYSYGKMIAIGFFEKSNRHNVTNQEFFLPTRKSNGSSRLLFMKKYIKE